MTESSQSEYGHTVKKSRNVILLANKPTDRHWQKKGNKKVSFCLAYCIIRNISDHVSNLSLVIDASMPLQNKQTSNIDTSLIFSLYFLLDIMSIPLDCVAVSDTS